MLHSASMIGALSEWRRTSFQTPSSRVKNVRRIHDCASERWGRGENRSRVGKVAVDEGSQVANIRASLTLLTERSSLLPGHQDLIPAVRPLSERMTTSDAHL